MSDAGAQLTEVVLLKRNSGGSGAPAQKNQGGGGSRAGLSGPVRKRPGTVPRHKQTGSGAQGKPSTYCQARDWLGALLPVGTRKGQ